MKKLCAWCGKFFPKDMKYSRKRQTGPFLIYFYKCPKCGCWTGIDYKLEVRAKMSVMDTYGSH